MYKTPFSRFKNRAVFVMGMKKSGTTLLTSLLDYHPQLVVFPEELKFVKVLYRDRMSDRPLSNRDKIDILIKKYHLGRLKHDTFTHSSSPRSPRDYSDIDYSAFARLLSARSEEARDDKELLLAIIESFYEVEHSPKEDKRAWVEKTPINYYYVPLFHKWFGDSLVCLHVVRDPYDNFASFRKFLRKPPTDAVLHNFCLNWKLSNALARQWQKYFKRYHIISYEQLVTHPEKVMRQVASWLGIDYKETLLLPTINGKRWGGNSAYKTTFTSVSPSQVGKYKEVLSEREIRKIKHLLYGFSPFFRLKSYAYLVMLKLRWKFPRLSRLIAKMVKKIK
jgi:hypothetical protein